ncbi:MAG: hypothetical protein HRU37_08025 [Roseibacillus sp.]|nr:hypothetical protein [Roseibacillus sp.]
MNNRRRSNPALRSGKSRVMEILVGAAVLVIAIGIGTTIMNSGKITRSKAEALKKMRHIGEALKGYLDDNNGEFPLEDAPGKDNWLNAAKPEAETVWYNALTRQIGETPVSELGDNPASQFYQKSYPLFLSGADYPKTKREGKPYFAFGFNSSLQIKAEDGTEAPANLAGIQHQDRTVAFLERGVKKGEKTNKLQGGFDGGSKANAKNFVGRYKGKGHILFIDGHVEEFSFEDLTDAMGQAVNGQANVYWTGDPDSRPN